MPLLAISITTIVFLGLTIFGLQDSGAQHNTGELIEFDSSVDENFSIRIQPACKNIYSKNSRLWLATIPSNNIGNLRLITEFVFPVPA